MVTILQALHAINAYPFTDEQLAIAAVGGGLDPAGELTTEVLQSDGYKRATAEVYKMLSEAPNISQGGISFTFTAEDKRMFRDAACKILSSLDTISGDGSGYGYIGEDF